MTDDRRQGEPLSLPPLVTESVRLDIAARMLAAMVRANADDIARWAAINTQGEPTAITYADRKRVALSLLLADELIARCTPAPSDPHVIRESAPDTPESPAKPTPSIFTVELTPDQARALAWVRSGEGGRREWSSAPNEFSGPLGALAYYGLVTVVANAHAKAHYELTRLGEMLKPA